MARERKRRKKANEKKQDSGFEFCNFGIPPEHHAEFKAAVLEAARAGVAEYPGMLKTVKEQLTNQTP